jgi:ABC-type multidrug transport system, ATPase component
VLLSSHLLAQAQEICDRIGILADGVLVREGRLQELIAIENQTELVIADASDDLVQEIESFISRSNAKLSSGENRPPRWKDCSWNRPEGTTKAQLASDKLTKQK